MKSKLDIILAQLNLVVGDIYGNSKKILKIIDQQNTKQCDLIIFPELSLTGYCPEDLLFNSDFYDQCMNALNNIRLATKNVAVVLGHPWKKKKKIYNALSFFWKKKRLAIYYKQKLPNYGLFDEKRYFCSGNKTCVTFFKNYKIGFLICEDVWHTNLVDNVKKHGANIIIVINASPYNYKKYNLRLKLLKSHCRRINLPIIYLNLVGGQDELIFDGNSIILNSKGDITHKLSVFKEEILKCTFQNYEPIFKFKKIKSIFLISEIYKGLVFATSEYVRKNGFSRVVLGISGGIDSALTAAIAVDALNKENVHAVMMPFKYTSRKSIRYAVMLSKMLGIRLDIINITSIYNIFIKLMMPTFSHKKKDITEENLQSRCRSVILMSISNKNKSLVLTCNNKSELSIGYTTIYGDMAGGFSVLKDVSKTLVYKLAKYRNKLSRVIPKGIINRMPTAELFYRQKDYDSLPKYNVLDSILKGYIEKNQSMNELLVRGFNIKAIKKIVELIRKSEYKRYQSAIGPTITTKNLSKDRRYPVTYKFKYYD
ncbi:MAG: NAD+ synthase [Arsenophonus sp.]|nr:MAG: NAD+ synthase [Arsenophonus sp.]